jgi:hypothetical protein
VAQKSVAILCHAAVWVVIASFWGLLLFAFSVLEAAWQV